jgi:hypothetical protein
MNRMIQLLLEHYHQARERSQEAEHEKDSALALHCRQEAARLARELRALGHSVPEEKTQER